MKILLAMLLGLTWIGPALAQSPIPTLEPCDVSFTGYRQGVAKQIRSTLNSDYDLSVTVYPAFTAEWAVSLIQGREGPEIVLSDFKQSYWHSGWVDVGGGSKKWDPAAAHALIDTKRHEIPVEVSERLREAWDIALTQVRSYEKNWFGLDGVTYEFRDGAGRCGSTWVPQEGTLPGRLVTIINELKVLAVSRVEPDTTEREQEMLARLDTFLGEFGGRSEP